MVTEQMPTYPGGRPAWEKYLRENLRYPAEAQTEQVQGTVYVAFIIRPDGSVDNPQVVKGIGHGCDEEALRLVREMPNWIPGKQGGQPVSVRYSLPVSFFLRP